MFYNLKNGFVAVRFVENTFKVYDSSGAFVGWMNLQEVIDFR